ncbi:efflux RND transporter periplasmic adaptor subunit [Candidatus Shapirobacteria bacterium]|nr:efflux RND transporter periplasmic adaptor subunit [Candidatus Shapirobacteria bacterium]
MKKIKKAINWFRARRWCWLLAVILVGIGVFFFFKSRSNSSPNIQIQTATVEKGTLVVTIAASGSITSASDTDIVTAASGVVKTVLVNNGDKVVKGQKIAEITPDEEGAARQSDAYLAYLESQEAVKTAQKEKAEADIAMWEARKAILDAQEAIDYKNNNTINPATKEEYTEEEKAIIDKTLDKAKAAFEEAELKFKNADVVIANVQAKQAAAWRNYQKSSAIIYSPAAGVVSNLTLSPGVVLAAETSTSDNNTASTQTLGKIKNPQASLQATVNLSEFEVTKVKPGQKVTLTLDAYPGKTFTGKILAVNTSGSSSQGVVSYPATILLDPTTVEIYQNMAVSAQIILDSKTDVLLVPSSAIKESNGKNFVEVVSDEGTKSVAVEVGENNDTMTEIISGLSEGQTVVSSKVDLSQKVQFGSSGSTFGGASPFGGGGEFRPR